MRPANATASWGGSSVASWAEVSPDIARIGPGPWQTARVGPAMYGCEHSWRLVESLYLARFAGPFLGFGLVGSPADRHRPCLRSLPRRRQGSASMATDSTAAGGGVDLPLQTPP